MGIKHIYLWLSCPIHLTLCLSCSLITSYSTA
jgi:hypothetical protein